MHRSSCHSSIRSGSPRVHQERGCHWHEAALRGEGLLLYTMRGSQSAQNHPLSLQHHEQMRPFPVGIKSEIKHVSLSCQNPSSNIFTCVLDPPMFSDENAMKREETFLSICSCTDLSKILLIVLKSLLVCSLDCSMVIPTQAIFLH